MNIIDERDKRNKARRRMKDIYDSQMHLSENERWYRLLQEGMITYSDGSPQFYIMRGVINDFYENLDPSYVGSINIGHTDLATFPERIVGKWTKENLRVVDIEDGRQALETNLPVNHEHPLIKALEQSEFDLGLSVEMRIHINDDLYSSEQNPFHVAMVEEIEVFDFAIVGNAGDVNSMGVELKGELPKMDERLKKLAELLADENTTSLAAVNALLDKSLTEAEEVKESEEPVKAAEETVEASEEEVVEESTEEVEEASEETVEESEEETEESEAEAEESNPLDEVLARIQALTDEVADLRSQLADRDSQLAARAQAEKEFVTKFKNLSVSLTKEVKQKEAPKVQYTDGIGE